MIWIITRREILDNLLSSRFALATILCLILIVLGSYVSIKDYERRMGEYSTGVQEQKGEHAAYMPKVYRKPEVLGIFSQGIERKLGNIVDSRDYFHNGRINLTGEMGTYGSGQSIYLKTLAPIDFDFVVRVVMSLLAIFLAYDAVSGEREAGVLKLSLANAVPRSDILIGKFLSGVFCICIPLTMSTIVAILMMQLSDLVRFDAAEWGRLGIIFSLSILYLAVFYVLGLFVSCLTKTSTMSLTISMLIWILALVIVPNAGPALVKQFWHITSRSEMMHQRDQLYMEYIKKEYEKFGPWDKRDESDKTRAQLQTLWHERTRALWKLGQEHIRELDRQAEAGRWAARFSPSSAFSFAISAIARTDIGTYKRFMRSAHSFFTQTENLQKLRYDLREEYKRRAEEYRYSFRISESLADSFRDAVPDIALLLLFAVVFFMGAYAAFIRYDVI